MSKTKTEVLTPDPIEAEMPPGRVAQKSAAAMVPVTSGGIAIQNLEELMKFSSMLVRDGACPKGWSVGQVAVAIQSGLQVGLGLLGGLQQGAVINGIFSWRGQAAVALIQNSGTCKLGSLRFGCRGEGDGRVGYAVGHRVGYAKPEERSFSVADARRADLWGKTGPWTLYPERMLAWRAVGLLARDIFPDVLGGFPLAEEATDFDERQSKTRSEGRPEFPAPASHDPLMEAIEGKASGDRADTNTDKRQSYGRPSVRPPTEPATEVEFELVPEATALPTEAEQPTTLVNCRHGVKIAVFCVDCNDEYSALAAEKES